MNHPQLATETSALRMPGATLVTRLKVYDSPAPDGQRGGTPHFHFLCTEMYFVLGGEGAVEMIDGSGFSRVELHPHSALVFTPGTIHRLINPDGNLEILVVMQNSGLPERGDNVVCFSSEWLADNVHFAEAMRVTSLDEAYRRRDRGVEGFLKLQALFEQDPEIGRKALTNFYEQAAARIAGLSQQWQTIVTEGALAEAQKSLREVEMLMQGQVDYLFSAQQHLIHEGAASKLGFCGHLNRYFDPVTLSLEGISQS
jgi:mannose-6-phosphate isomerase-like protein (cupin superfamily)